MKDSMLSIISNTHDRLNTNALLGMLASLYPALAPLTSIGAILSSYNSANQEKKFKEFALELANTLKKHEEKLQNIPDDLEELVLIASDGILRTPSRDKIKYYAKLISGHISGASAWNETVTALRILDDIEDLHIQILNVATHFAQIGDMRFCFYIKVDGYKGKGMVGGSIDIAKFNIMEKLTGCNSTEIQLFCMQLMAKGLLHDNDQGRTSSGPVFTLTEAATWFLAKIELLAKSE